MSQTGLLVAAVAVGCTEAAPKSERTSYMDTGKKKLSLLLNACVRQAAVMMPVGATTKRCSW